MACIKRIRRLNVISSSVATLKTMTSYYSIIKTKYRFFFNIYTISKNFTQKVSQENTGIYVFMQNKMQQKQWVHQDTWRSEKENWTREAQEIPRWKREISGEELGRRPRKQPDWSKKMEDFSKKSKYICTGIRTFILTPI